MRLALLALAALLLLTGCPKRPAPTRSQDVRSWPDLQAGWKARVEQGNGSADARAAFERAMVAAADSSETGSRRLVHRELTACLEAAKREADDWGFYVCAIADADQVADSRDRPEARLALEDVDSRNVFQGVRGHILGSLAELDRVDCRHERALANAKLAVEILEGDLGETHVELAPVLSTLARLQNRRGEVLIARANADRVLQLKKQKFGEGSADYCSALELRASIYRTTSGFRGLLRAVELAEQAEGVESLRASRQRIKLAAYRIEDRSVFSDREFALPPAAIAAALERELALRRRLKPGVEGPWEAIIADWQSALAESSGDLDRAETFARRALEIRTALDADPCALAKGRVEIGRILAFAGRYEEAIPLLETDASSCGCPLIGAGQDRAAFLEWVRRSDHDDDEPLPVGGTWLAPIATSAPQAEYPKFTAYDVELVMTVGLDGRVESLEPLRGSGEFQEEAIRAVRRWEYPPLVVNGKPRRWTMRVHLVFRVEGEDRAFDEDE